MDLARIFRYLEDHYDRHVQNLQEFCRQPSISAEDYGVEECARLLADYYRRLGCQEVEIVPTEGHPCVWAYLDAGAPKTIVNYCMYDVQPVVGERWSSPPFDARIWNAAEADDPEVGPQLREDLKTFKRVLVARGAVNSKGPYRAWLNALEAIISVEKKPPVNIMFTAEGEEELMSPHFPQFIDKVRDRLRHAQAVLNPGASQNREGKVGMTLGFKGIVYFELEASGWAWGRGPKAYDVHSSMKAAVDSPAWRLIQALATMVSPDGNTITIDGFYDNIAPPSAEDLELVDALVGRWDETTWKQAFQVDRFIDDATGRELLLKYLFSTTLNIDGIWGGYTGPGTKTVLPHKVTCKMDVRLVPNQHSSEILPKIRAHLDKHGYSDIAIRQLSGYEWVKRSVRADVVQAVLRVYRRHGIEPLIFPHSGASMPMYLYARDPLNLPGSGGGLGHGGRAHSPDEYFVIEGNDRVAGLLECERSHVEILYAYARGETASQESLR